MRPFLPHQEALKGNIKRERSRNIYEDTRDRRANERVRRVKQQNLPCEAENLYAKAPFKR